MCEILLQAGMKHEATAVNQDSDPVGQCRTGSESYPTADVTFSGERAMPHTLLTATLLLCLVGPPIGAQEKKQPPPQPPPTVANVAYGTHERQVLDFWRAKSEKPN